jgi:hypothetical protein
MRLGACKHYEQSGSANSTAKAATGATLHSSPQPGRLAAESHRKKTTCTHAQDPRATRSHPKFPKNQRPSSLVRKSPPSSHQYWEEGKDGGVKGGESLCQGESE